MMLAAPHQSDLVILLLGLLAQVTIMDPITKIDPSEIEGMLRMVLSLVHAKSPFSFSSLYLGPA